MLVILIGIIALADSGAYFAGKWFGKHKLAPLVSPGKTIEGMIGGLVLSLCIVLAVGTGLDIDLHRYISLIIVTCLVALFSVVGDLFESCAKRVANVKDSGNILPGHGGVLDRMDGVIAATPIFVLFQHYYPLA